MRAIHLFFSAAARPAGCVVVRLTCLLSYVTTPQALEAATRFKGKRLQSINGEEVWEFSALAAATEGVQAQPLPAEIVPPPDDEENENALYPNQGGVAVGVPVDLENHGE